MSPHSARLWLTKASLVSYASAFLFFAVSPGLGYPLAYSDSITILKIILPVFAGHIGAAATFAISQDENRGSPVCSRLLLTLMKWPIWIFAGGLIATLIVLPISNAGAFSGDGLTPHTLSLLVAILAGLMSITTGAISTYLFKLEKLPDLTTSATDR